MKALQAGQFHTELLIWTYVVLLFDADENSSMVDFVVDIYGELNGISTKKCKPF